MRKLLTAIFGLAFCLNTYAMLPDVESDKLEEGYVYVHTMRNAPKLTRNGVEIKTTRGSLISANGLNVETLDGQYLTLILSNRTAIYINGKAKFSIERFVQVIPFRAFLNDEHEAVRSNLRMNIEYGDIYISCLTPRATSRTVIKTKFGILEPKSTAFCIFCTNKQSSFVILTGQSLFCSLDNKKDFIQQNQIGIVEEISSNKMYPLKIESLTTSEEKAYKKQLSLGKAAIQSIDFKFTETGKMTAQRLVPKEFLIQHVLYE